MGMDIYGLNPTLITEKPKMIDFDEASEEERDEYFGMLEEFERKNPGYYFRANVWWWRPIWEFTCEMCEDILTIEDKRQGHYNEGYQYSAEKTQKIVDKLSAVIATNMHHQYDRDYKKQQEELPDSDCETCEGVGTLFKDAGKEDCHVCNGKGTVSHFGKNYPFEPEVIEDWYEFLKNSGGFQIF